ncbi:MAG: glycosyltransferase [Gammaproteobacteria bacterium]|nr:glycosyltransferase [Gammaproteobacteria bacterium]
MDFVILIPAYQPDDTLLQLIHDLSQLSPNQQFILVNDGSTTEKSKDVFKKLSASSNITLLTHDINQGKGAALKTGFKYFLEHFSDKKGIVTADADGQHLPQDILNVGNALTDNHALILGVRQFSQSIPWRSRFGNELTRKVFSWFSGVYVNDTQTGLRALSTDVIREVSALPEEGYAFEMDMLMLATTHKWTVKQVPIQTVYINQNRASHFNPLLDSLKIYFVFLRYSVLSVLSAVIDFSLFFIGFHFSRSILASTVFARILSGIFNFKFCKKLIFKSNGNAKKEAIQYLLLALASLFLSFSFVSFFYHVAKFNIFWSKLVGDSLIFLGNFLVQRFLIFKASSA